MILLDFTSFNLLEGCFWVALSILALHGYKYATSLKIMFWRLLALDLILFGISDFLEVYTQTSFFSPGFEWLLIWKVMCLILFLGLLGYYFVKRIRE